MEGERERERETEGEREIEGEMQTRGREPERERPSGREAVTHQSRWYDFRRDRVGYSGGLRLGFSVG